MNPEVQKAGQKAIDNVKANANLVRDPQTIGAIFAYVEALEVECGLRAPSPEAPAATAVGDTKSDKKKSK